MTACGTAQNEAKVSAVKNPVASGANETATQPSSESSPQISPSESVKVRATEITVQAGESAEATVEVVVAGGYHINSNYSLKAKVMKLSKFKISIQSF